MEMTFNEVIKVLSNEKITAIFIPMNLRRRLVSGTPYGYYKIKSSSLGAVTIRVTYDEDMDFPHSDEISIDGPNLSRPLYAWDYIDKYRGEESFKNGLNFVKTLTWASRLRTLGRSCFERGK